MYTSLKIIAASLSLLGFANNALAQQAPQVTEWPLGMAIAYQGDEALLGIRESLKQSIPQSINQMMSNALPQELATVNAGSDFNVEAAPADIVVISQ